MNIYELTAELRKAKISSLGDDPSFKIVGWLTKKIEVIGTANVSYYGRQTGETVTATVGHIKLKGQKIHVQYTEAYDIGGSHKYMDKIAQWIADNTDLVRGN
jgi:hypothetical protein